MILKKKGARSLTQQGHEPEVTRNANLLCGGGLQAFIAPPKMLLKNFLFHHYPKRFNKFASHSPA
jgi:hypothetical protein